MLHVSNSGPPSYRAIPLHLALTIRQAEAEIMRVARAIAVGALQGDEALDALRDGIARYDAAQVALVASWEG